MLEKKSFLVGMFILFSLSLAISAQPLHPTTGEPLVIDCLRGTPDAIDGDLSDWNLDAMIPAVLDAAEQLYSGQENWTGPEDCSGKFYMMWDDEKIYIAAVVKDDVLSMNKTDGSIWNADCVEVFLATTDARADHSWSNPTIHYQYGFNANNQKWNWCNMDGPGQSDPDYLQIAATETADGYICEASIEYGQLLSLDFSAGNTIGLHTSIDDTDIENGDTEVFMTWTGLAPHDQSMGYGHVILSADAVPEPAPPVVLRVDFNSNQDGGGDSTTADDPGLSEAAHNQEGWSSYHANHEVIDEFAIAVYDGITVTPDWPNTTDNRVRQSIDRGSGNDSNWDDAAGDLNLVTDWIGIDTRTGNGGNGDWDGTTGTPTYMTLALGGLAAGDYNWTSFHHDTEHCHGPFAVWLSTDGGVTFTQLDDGVMTDSTPGGSPDSGATEVGPDANTLSSTYRTSFSADGVNDVVFRFAPYSEGAVHRQIWGMNGFVLELPAAPAADPSLSIYYTFDEVSDIVADQSGKGHDGLVVGDVSAVAEGILAGAAKFATGSYLDLDGPNFPAEDIPTSAMTLAAWINCENTGGDHEIFSARASDNTWLIHPEPKSSGDIRWLLRSYGGTTIFQIRAGTMTWGEWLHFAGTYDKESAKAALYVNGELIQEMDVENPADIAGDWGLGARVGLTIDDARPFTGLMDEFRMYTRALSADEIAGL